MWLANSSHPHILNYSDNWFLLVEKWLKMRCASEICLWTDSCELLSLAIFPPPSMNIFLRICWSAWFTTISNLCMFSLGRTKTGKINPPGTWKGQVSSAKCFTEINSINIYLAPETLGTLFTNPGQLCLTFSGCWFSWWLKMWSCTVWTLVPSQRCDKFAYISSISQQCVKKDMSGTKVLTSPRSTHVYIFIHTTSRAFHQSSFAFFCFPSWLFSCTLFWMFDNQYLYCTQHSIHSLVSCLFFFFQTACFIFSIESVCYPSHCVVLSFKQYGIFHFFSFFVARGKLFILLGVKRDQK